MKTTKRYCRALMLGLALLPLTFTGCFVRNFGYSFDYSGSSVSRTQTGEISPNTNSIEIVNRWGNVSVQEVSGNESTATWTWSGTAWGTTVEDAETYLAELDMIVTEDGDSQKFEIVYPGPDSELRGIKSHLTLQIPQGTSITVKNRHGESNASGLSGSTAITSSHGDVTVSDMIGPVNVTNNHAKTVGKNLLSDSQFDSNHGSITITGSEQTLIALNDHGSINITDSRGNVTAQNDHGSIKIKTSTTISDLNPDIIISAENDHGSIKIDVGSDQVKRISVDNDHGSVGIQLPGSAKPKLDLKSEHGSAKSEFRHHADGKLSIKGRTDHGSIRIRKK